MAAKKKAAKKTAKKHTAKKKAAKKSTAKKSAKKPAKTGHTAAVKSGRAHLKAHPKKKPGTRSMYLSKKTGLWTERAKRKSAK